MWRNQAGIVVMKFLQVHLKRKSRLPRVGNGLGIKYIHGQGRLQAVSLFSSVSHARGRASCGETARRGKRGRQPERKKFPVSRIQSRACAFSRVSFDGPTKERLLVVYGRGKDGGNFMRRSEGFGYL